LNKKLILSFLVFFLFLPHLWAKADIVSDSLRILERGAETRFKGNVVIKSDGVIVNAARAVSKKNENIVEASGDVFVEYSSGSWRVQSSCRFFEIILDEKKFIMKGDVVSDYTEEDTGILTHIVSEKAIFYYGSNKEALFEGGVQAEREGITVNSGRAYYSKIDDMMEFTEDPVATNSTETVSSVYSGEVIILYSRQKHIRITGSAHTEVFFKNESGM
jgi:lipopolysaccharide assembly outer membrane protein LptD (OstA)